MKFLASGRVLPERAYVSFGPIFWNHPNGGKVKVFSDHGQLSVSLDLPDLDNFNSAHTAAEHFAQLVVSALGFTLGSGYSVEIIQIFEEDGTPHVFGVRHQNLVHDEHQIVFDIAVRLASEDVFFRLALRDYVRAINDQTDCATYCYRAIEAIQSSFAFQEKKKDGWSAMHLALGTSREKIERTVKIYADPVRHGNWIEAKSIDGTTRTEMLLSTKEILSNYLAHKRNGH
jgi:hypothetical protein